MSTPGFRRAASRRRSVAGTIFESAAETHKSVAASFAGGVAALPTDKENLTNSPSVAFKKKRKARVSFSTFDEFLVFDTEDAARGLGTKLPSNKKTATISTPPSEKHRLSLPSETANDTLESLSTEDVIPSPTPVKDASAAIEAEIVTPQKSAPIEDASTPEATPPTQSTNNESFNGEQSFGEMLGQEITLDDVLAQDLDVGALPSAADDELSAIYASGKQIRISLGSGLVHEANESTERDTNKNNASQSEPENDDEPASWSMHGGNLRASFGVPSFTRRDSFSLLSTRHLRSGPTSDGSNATALPPRRDSMLMEMTQSDIGTILEAEKEEQVMPPPPASPASEHTMRLPNGFGPSRRTSMVMDMTRTDYGEIMENFADEEPATTTVNLKSRRNSLMDLTMGDYGEIMENAEEVDEDEVAQRTIRMELTRTDLSLLLDSQQTDTINIRSTITLKNRRQSLAMEETVSNFGAILESAALEHTTSEDTNQVNESRDENNASTATTPESYLATSVFETAEDVAAKPKSTLMDKLQTMLRQHQQQHDNSEQGDTTRLKLRRQSVAMDMTFTNFGEILLDSENANTATSIVTGENEVTEAKTNERRQSIQIEELPTPVEMSMELEDADTQVIIMDDQSIVQSEAIEEKKVEEEVVSAEQEEVAAEAPTTPTELHEAPVVEVETPEKPQEAPVASAQEEPAVIAQEVEQKEEVHETTANLNHSASDLNRSTPTPQVPSIPVTMENPDDILFSDVVSLTSSFPHLSMSLTSRNALRNAIDAATATSSEQQEPIMEKIEPSPTNASHMDDIRTPRTSFAPQDMEITMDSSKMDAVARQEMEQEQEEDSVAEEVLVAGDEDMPTFDMSLTSMQNFLEEETKLLAKRRTRAPLGAEQAARLLRSLAPGSPQLNGQHMSSDSPNTNDLSLSMDYTDDLTTPLLKAIQQGVPKVKPRPVVANNDATVMAQESTVEEMANEEDAERQNAMEVDSEEESMMEMELDDVTATLSSSGDDVSAKLDLAQRQFESHVESQLRNIGARKSLLAQSTMTPFASRRNSMAVGVLTPEALDAPTQSTSLMSMANSAAHEGMTGQLTTIMSMASATGTLNFSNLFSTSLVRFLNSFGVNFLDGMASRRQSIGGMRVPEPRSEYDRMMTLFCSQPEMELMKGAQSVLTALLTEYDAKLTQLESDCKAQCAERTGIYHLFAHCLTASSNSHQLNQNANSTSTHQQQLGLDVRKDLAQLKTLSLSQARIFLNENHIGLYFENHLNAALTRTTETLTQHLSQLQDRQAATITTKMNFAKSASKPNSAVNKSSSVETAAAQTSATALKDKVKERQMQLERRVDAEALVQSLHGWCLKASTQTSSVFDFREAIEMVVELAYQGEVQQVGEIRLACVLRVRNAEHDEERQIMEKMIAAMDLNKWRGHVKVPEAVNEVATQVGRTLDLVAEMRRVARTWYIESVESVPSVGGLVVGVRFSNARTGKRFVARLAVGAHYPFVPSMNVEVDASFCALEVSKVEEIVEEEVSKNTYKLLTRVCRRLDRLCAE